MAGNLTNQVRGIAKVVTAVANGDLQQKLTVEAKGEIAALADTINAMTNTLAIFAEQVTTVAREVGVEGRLGGQANVPGTAGIWKDLTANVNRLAANLTSQVSSITNADMTNILNASSAIIAPYSAGNLKVTVSCLSIDSTGKVTVEWSDTKNGTARSKGSSVTIPSALAVPSSHLIFAEVSYAYTPTVGYTMTGTVNLSDTMYMAPRISATVARTTS